jgi:hypothetical protein
MPAQRHHCRLALLTRIHRMLAPRYCCMATGSGCRQNKELRRVAAFAVPPGALGDYGKVELGQGKVLQSRSFNA